MAEKRTRTEGTWPKRRGVTIRDREIKLRFFYEWDSGPVVDGRAERISCVHAFPFRDRKGMARALEIGDARLEGKMDRLSHTTLGVLGDYFGFDPNWPEWLRGKPWEFAKRYNQENWYKRADERGRNDIQLMSSRSEPTWALNKKLASLTLFANQEGGGTAQALHIELVCTPSPVELFELTVRRGDLSIVCENCEASDISEREANLSKTDLRRSPEALAITPFGTHVSPGWKLAIDTLLQTGWYITGHICDVRKLSPASVMTARFAVYAKDLEPSRERVGAEQISSGCYYSRAFKFEGFVKLSAAKKKVLELLALAPVTDENGYVELCRDRLKFDIHPAAGVGDF